MGIKYVLVALLIAFGVFTNGSVVHAQKDMTVNNVLAEVNNSRLKDLAAPVLLNDQLNRAAQKRAQDLFDKQYFSHVSPDGKRAWDFIAAEHYSYNAAGENLAIFYTDPTQMEIAWMNSPTHKANIINKKWTQAGIGIVKGKFQGKTGYIVVNLFAVPFGH